MRFGQFTTDDKPWLQRKLVWLYCRGCLQLYFLLSRAATNAWEHGQAVERAWGPYWLRADRIAAMTKRMEETQRALKAAERGEVEDGK